MELKESITSLSLIWQNHLNPLFMLTFYRALLQLGLINERQIPAPYVKMRRKKKEEKIPCKELISTFVYLDSNSLIASYLAIYK